MSLTVGLCSFNLSLVFILCTEVLNIKISKLDERKHIKERCTGKLVSIFPNYGTVVYMRSVK